MDFSSTVSVLKPLGYDVYGRPIPGALKSYPCSVVKLNRSSVKSTVRSDQGATVGFADEIEADAKLLIHPSFDAKQGDKIVCKGVELEITGARLQYDIFDALDHVEALCQLCRQ